MLHICVCSISDCVFSHSFKRNFSRVMPTSFAVDYAKRVAGCKGCKQKIMKEELRIARISPNPFIKHGDGEPVDMKNYFHPHCLFEQLRKSRASTKVVDTSDEVEGFDDLKEEDQAKIQDLIKDLADTRSAKFGDKLKQLSPDKSAKKETPKKAETSANTPSTHTGRKSMATMDESNDEEPILFAQVVVLLEHVDSPNDDRTEIHEFFRANPHAVGAVVKLFAPKYDMDRPDKYIEDDELKGYLKELKEESDVPHGYDLSLHNFTRPFRTTQYAMKIHSDQPAWDIEKVTRFIYRFFKDADAHKRKDLLKFAYARVEADQFAAIIHLLSSKIYNNSKAFLEHIDKEAFHAFNEHKDFSRFVKRVQKNLVAKGDPPKKSKMRKSSLNEPVPKRKKAVISDDE